MRVLDYLLTHREPPPAPGLFRLADDFAGAPAPPPPAPGPEPPPADWLPAVQERLDAIQRLVRQAQADRCSWDADYDTYRASLAQIMDHDIGPIHDLAAQARALLPAAPATPAPAPPPAPGPAPAPPPAPGPAPAVRAFAVSYAGHDPARDVYPGLDADQVEWGPHHGIALTAPAAGTVQAYQFPTPLARYQQLSASERGLYRALFAGWTCGGPTAYGWRWQDASLVPPEDQGWVVPAVEPYQVLYVAVFIPDAPLEVGGQRLRLCHYGHVHPEIRTGRVATGDVFAQVWDSGIHFEALGIPARAAHVHCAASTTGQLSPNGDVDGLLAAAALGWAVAWRGPGPGPNEYQSGQWAAGRPRADFARAGRPLPPPTAG